MAPLGSILVALGSLGLHFGSLGLHFGGLGLQGTPQVSPSEKDRFLEGFAPSIWVPIVVHFRIKIIKN